MNKTKQISVFVPFAPSRFNPPFCNGIVPPFPILWFNRGNRTQ